MAFGRGLTEIHSNFKTQARLVASDVVVNSLVFIDGVPYTIDSSNLGSGILLDNTLFANPVNPEITETEVVIPQTVSGTLTAGSSINQIRDSGAFIMPLANTVVVNAILIVELPDKFSDQTPTLTRAGADLFETLGSVDTDIAWVAAARLTLTSNGVDRWSL